MTKLDFEPLMRAAILEFLYQTVRYLKGAPRDVWVYVMIMHALDDLQMMRKV